MIEQIAQILEDLFGIPPCHVEASDNLHDDWGMSASEKSQFNCEFGAEFDLDFVPNNLETIEDYLRLLD